MYLVMGAKLYNINICECHIGLFASKLYLVYIQVVFLCVCIKLVWEYYYNMTLLTSFIDNHEFWFCNKYSFV